MNFDLTILGSGSALPTSRRNPTAHALEVHEHFFLIDCGEGTQLQIRNAKLKLSSLNQIFISHLHGDHIFGLFGLFSTLNLLGRRNELQLFGPPGLQQIVEFYEQTLTEGNQYKISVVPIHSRGFTCLFSSKKVEVFSFPLKHRVPSWGFLFLEKEREPNIRKEMVERYHLKPLDILQLKKGNDFITSEGNTIPNAELTIPASAPRSFAFCSDTAYYERIAAWIEGVDLLYHEATFANSERKIAKQTGHSTAQQAASIAKKAGVKKLLIGHFSNRYKDVSLLLREAKEVFPETYLAEDLEVHGIGQKTTH